MNREVHVQFWEGVGLRCPALLAYLRAYESVAEARQGVAAYFNFYNHERVHQALDYRAPRQVFEGRDAGCQASAREGAADKTAIQLVKVQSCQLP